MNILLLKMRTLCQFLPILKLVPSQQLSILVQNPISFKVINFLESAKIFFDFARVMTHTPEEKPVGRILVSLTGGLKISDKNFCTKNRKNSLRKHKILVVILFFWSKMLLIMSKSLGFFAYQ